jgi:RecA/RadA recombinase
MSISEVYGEFSESKHLYPLQSPLTGSGCGKTQLAHTMAVTAQLPRVCKKANLRRRLLTMI